MWKNLCIQRCSISNLLIMLSTKEKYPPKIWRPDISTWWQGWLFLEVLRIFYSRLPLAPVAAGPSSSLRKFTIYESFSQPSPCLYPHHLPSLCLCICTIFSVLLRLTPNSRWSHFEIISLVALGRDLHFIQKHKSQVPAYLWECLFI